MIHHFGSLSPEVTLELKKKKVVKFVDHELVTDEDDVAKQIEAGQMFKAGQIYRKESTIAGANQKRGPKVVSGSRGTDTNNEISLLQAELEKARGRIRELEKSK